MDCITRAELSITVSSPAGDLPRFEQSTRVIIARRDVDDFVGSNRLVPHAQGRLCREGAQQQDEREEGEHEGQIHEAHCHPSGPSTRCRSDQAHDYADRHGEGELEPGATVEIVKSQTADHWLQTPPSNVLTLQ